MKPHCVDQISLETEFSIAICRPTGDNWQSIALFLARFDPRLSIVKSVFYCRLSGVETPTHELDLGLFGLHVFFL